MNRILVDKINYKVYKNGIMTWIREAEISAQQRWIASERAREQLRDNQIALQAEPVSEDAILEFLEPLKSPILKVVEDLRQAGYGVWQGNPEYLFDLNLTAKRANLTEYSLARRKSSPSHDREVFGVEWTINQGDQFLGAIRIYPTIGERTHFGGATYLAGSKLQLSRVADSTQEENEIVLKLQQAVASWIKPDTTRSA